MIQANKIKLLKENYNTKNNDDLQWVNEFYDFLRGQYPENIQFSKGSGIKLSSNKAFSIIYYLQEHFPLLPDYIEQCSQCKLLYNQNSSGYHSELTQKFYCDACFPPFLDEREDRILQRRYNKKKK